MRGASRRRGVGEEVTVALDDLANLEGKGVVEHRAAGDDGMKLTVLATGVNGCGEGGEKGVIEAPAHEGSVQMRGIHTDGVDDHPAVDHGACKGGRVAFPKGEE